MRGPAVQPCEVCFDRRFIRKNNATRHLRNGWQAMCEPIGASPPYLGVAALGNDQHVRRENDSPDRFLILLNFVREAKALEQVAYGRVLDLQACSRGKGVPQFKQRDIRILGNQFFKEIDMGCQFA